MIIFLHGADTFRSRRLLQEMKNKFIADTDKDAGSLILVDGRETSLKELSEKINTGSLFVKKRLVVVNDIFKNKKAGIFTGLTDYLKKFTQAEEIIIIFIDGEIGGKENSLKADAKKLFAFLARQKFVQEFKPLNNLQLMAFIKKEASQYEKEFLAKAAARLLVTSGSDPWIITSEIKKLAFYSQAHIITEKDVDELCVGSISEDIFALTDALSAKNKVGALKLLEEQYAAGLSDEYLISMLIRQIKILLQIRDLLDSGADQNIISNKLKLHPYVIKKGLAQARNFSSATLKNILDRLIHLDFANKTGLSQIKTELMLLITEL